MRRPLLLLLGSLALGVLFGRAMSQIPSPRDVHVFWVGNLCAPWLLLAFLAGRAQRGWPWAVAAGVTTDVGCVGGFYSEFLLLPLRDLGLPAGTSTLSATATDAERWLIFISPWLVAAILGGIAYGLLGWWWHTSRPLAAAVALGLPFLAEPALWPVDNGSYKGPWPVWALEVAAGVAVIGFMAGRRRRVSPSSSPDTR